MLGGGGSADTGQLVPASSSRSPSLLFFFVFFTCAPAWRCALPLSPLRLRCLSSGHSPLFAERFSFCPHLPPLLTFPSRRRCHSCEWARVFSRCCAPCVSLCVYVCACASLVARVAPVARLRSPRCVVPLPHPPARSLSQQGSLSSTSAVSAAVCLSLLPFRNTTRGLVSHHPAACQPRWRLTRTAGGVWRGPSPNLSSSAPTRTHRHRPRRVDLYVHSTLAPPNSFPIPAFEEQHHEWSTPATAPRQRHGKDAACAAAATKRASAAG